MGKLSRWWHIGHNGTHEQYALTCDEFEQLVKRAEGRCDRCGVVYPNLVVDHDHGLGPRGVRGMLCHRCNSILGRIETGRREIDELTTLYFASPFHALIPAERTKDLAKMALLGPPPPGWIPRPNYPARGRNRPRRGVRVDRAH